MRLAHLADLHLGYRAYQRTAPGGRNQREVDVLSAFHAALHQVIEAQPDLILVAGDHYHQVRPSNRVLLESLRAWRALRVALPGVPVLMVAGNHEYPRERENGCALELLSDVPGVTVLMEPGWRVLETPAGPVTVYGLPDTGHPLPLPAPADGPLEAGYRLLVAHADAAGGMPWYCEEGSRHVLTPAQLEGWDYVALGHYHVTHAVTPRAWYAGALDYVSSNPWAELRDEEGNGKGWLLVRLDGGDCVVERRDVVGTRSWRDVPPLDATGMDATALMGRITTDLEDGPLDGAVVRYAVQGVAPDVLAALDRGAIRALKGRALNLRLELELAPDPVARDRRADIRGRSLADLIADKLAGHADREALMALAERTLADVTPREP